ncbi:uracil/xanthine transporter [Bacillus sp. DTU_2020_1000418_1_SI_GHA_SEK_038]|uniref:uracil/xanthine transporter n=1 Tax=Bacillus sp. DTU_2020_1000418_1_SI_GHA_SEK_038 TaxID=3077585 RepID=UPI0028F0898F|nr:uracil/xanthine transporter [Bacillus sp. DTU_2020_1000418_1_SI_GHA_SEK_038]WNS76512.1 uracil/xanthine transporter [Bacillus sp. DTU_2020_1000418_1_SI_GHA_SEK_038]
MNENRSAATFLAGIQWLFFMLANTVVIPITIGHAFDLSSIEVISALQRSFIFTGIACILQALVGHKYPLMEGQSGIWWGAVLSLSASASTSGISVSELGGGLAIGIIISGVLVVVLGLLGLGNILKRLFTPVVMSTVLFLLAVQLIGIFTKGMLGLSTGDQIDIPTASLSIFLVILVIWINVKGPKFIRSFSLLIGIVTGWILYELLFPASSSAAVKSTNLIHLFPWGHPTVSLGLIITAVITGLVNTTNTIAAIKGFEPMVDAKTTDNQYKKSIMLTGANSIVSGLFGMVPYAPYVSTLGFLKSTLIFERAPMIIGSVVFMFLGFVPSLSQFFSTLPISVGNAVLFVAYLQLFNGAISNLRSIHFTTNTIYRIAAPILLGIAIMNIPADMFASIPMFIRPLLSSGLLMGILLSIFLENTINWSKLDCAEKSLVKINKVSLESNGTSPKESYFPSK